MHVADLMKGKENKVYTIDANQTVHELARELKEKKVGALVVSDTNQPIVGIVSERDALQAFAEHGTAVINLHVKDIMTHREQLISVTRQEHIEKVMDIITRNRIRHVPVIEDGQLLGMISIGDVIKNRLDMVLFENEAMRKYISGI